MKRARTLPLGRVTPRHRGSRAHSRVRERDVDSSRPCDRGGVMPPVSGRLGLMAALSYAHGPSPTPLLGESIGENLRRAALRFGDRDALVVRSQRYRATYREFWDATSRIARGLIAFGVKRGDRVGIWSPNRFEWV